MNHKKELLRGLWVGLGFRALNSRILTIRTPKKRYPTPYFWKLLEWSRPGSPGSCLQLSCDGKLMRPRELRARS